MSRKIPAAIALGVFALFSFAAASAALDDQVIASETREVGPLTVTEETVQAGNDPVARFTVHRVFKGSAARRGALLLMPPGGSNFDFYTSNEEGKELQSLAAYFALRGFEVWGYSPRTRGLALGVCSGAVDCSGMRDWGLQAFVEDGLSIRERMREVLGEERPVVGGFSLGAMAAIALIDASPDDWAGAVLLDGMLYSADPEVQAANRFVCEGLKAQLAAGVLWDDLTYPFVRLLHELAVEEPDAPTFLPDFPAGTTNHQAYVAAFSAPAPAPPGYVPGYTLAVGSAEEERFFYSTEERLGLYFLGVNDYDPLALVRDYTCALGGERTFTDHLAGFTAPVLALGAGHGFGPRMGDNLGLLGSADVTWIVDSERGHLDLFASPDHRQRIEKPVLEWLERVAIR